MSSPTPAGPDAPSAHPWLQRVTSPLAAVLVLAGFWLLLVAAGWNQSLTYDETVHAAAGYSYTKFDDYRLNPENGNLPQRIAALPLLSDKYPFPSTDSPAWRLPDEWTVGDLWFNRMGHDVAGMLHRGRAFAALQAVALAALVWACSRRIFGPVGGMLSLLLCVLNPTLLANGGLMTSDTSAALFFLAATWAWWSLLHRLSPARLILSALAVSGLFVAKMSAILIVPIAATLLVARLIDGRPLPLRLPGLPTELTGRGRQLLAFTLAALLQAAAVYVTIWGFYGFRYAAFAPGQPSVQGSTILWDQLLGRKSLPEMVTALGLPAAPLQRAQRLLDDRNVPLYGWDAVSDSALAALRQEVLDPAQSRRLDELIASGGAPTAMERTIVFLRRHELLPEAYIFGSLHAWRFAQMRSAFFNGEFSRFGAASFFPYTFLVKTPLAMFGVLALAAAAAVAWWRTPAAEGSTGGRIRESVYATLPLWTLFAFYWIAVLNSRLNIGHRHILATYPPLFVLGGAAGSWIEGWLATATSRLSFSRATRFTGIAVASLVAVQGIEIAARFPHYLAYFNGIIRPAEGYRHFVDSTLDWGQDLPGLRDYIAEHPAAGPFHVSYFGNGDPRTYGIKAHFLPSNPGRFLQDTPPVLYRPVSAKPSEAELAALARELPDYAFAGVGSLGGQPNAVLIKKWEALRPARGGTFIFSATNFQTIWREQDEINYRELKRQVSFVLGVDTSTARPDHSIPEWSQIMSSFEDHQRGRLATFLLQYKPDDYIGYSMLVFKLTDADLARALDGPPPTGVYLGKTLRDAAGK